MAGERGNGATGAEAAGHAAPAPGTPPGADPLDLRARLDRYGDLLSRGLDLMEAGLNLGLTVATTVGAAAQQRIIERMLDPAPPESAAPPPQPQPQPGAMPAAAVGPGMPAASPEVAAYGITNRLPLVPGEPASISFSINNDSADAPRPVRLQAEGFRGETTGHVLPPGTLQVVPPDATIAPMDFEKFVLTGTIPAGTPPDTYRSSILVSAEAGLSIPVWLAVGPAARGGAA